MENKRRNLDFKDPYFLSCFLVSVIMVLYLQVCLICLKCNLNDRSKPLMESCSVAPQASSYDYSWSEAGMSSVATTLKSLSPKDNG